MPSPFILFVLFVWGVVASAAEGDFPHQFFSQHCFKCHGPERQKGNLRLDTLGGTGTGGEVSSRWGDVLDMLTHNEMPPDDEPRPPVGEVETVRAWIEDQLQAAYAGSGPPPLGSRRLSRTEYLLTIRDLLGVNIDSFDPTVSFPNEERRHGFDHLGGNLGMSNFLLEQLLTAASKSIEKVADIPAAPPPFNRVFGPDDFLPPRKGQGWDSSRFLFRPMVSYVVNMDGKYVDLGHGTSRSKRLNIPDFKGVPVDGFYKVTVRAEGHGRINPYNPKLLGVDPSEPILMQIIANNPEVGDGGSGYNISNRVLATVSLLDDLPKDYSLTVWLDRGFEVTVRYPNGPQDFRQPALKIIEKYHPESLVSNYRDEFSKKPPDGEQPKRWFSEAYQGPRLRIHSMKIEAVPPPLWPQANYRTLFCTDHLITNSLDAPKIIDTFAKRAFRRPLLPGETAPYQNLYRRLAAQDEPVYAIRGALKAILCSPAFMYIGATPNPGVVDAKALSADQQQYALASRLSYFLWSSMPDAALLDAAARGALDQPEEISRQVLRMLVDARSHALVERFTDAWLELHLLGYMPPQEKKYQKYETQGLEVQMRNETRMFFEYILKQNRDIAEFIDCDYAFLTEDLAKHYGVPGVVGREFRRVPLPPGSIQGGVVTQASVLTVTANGIETSPVKRGVWVLENILGTPPNPPPPNVAALEPDIRGATTIRERLQKHQNVELCATCHAKIDPLGLPLEMFDPIGGQRTHYEDNPNTPVLAIDTHTKLHSGEEIADIRDMKRVLHDTRQDQFALMLTRKMLTYAMGRELVLADRPSVDRIIDELGKRGHGLRDLIELVATSESFMGGREDSQSSQGSMIVSK